MGQERREATFERLLLHEELLRSTPQHKKYLEHTLFCDRNVP